MTTAGSSSGGNQSSESDPVADGVTLLIDGKSVRVPKGTNLIKAAASVGVEIPHYCYHPHLSVAGNCRMCQVEVKGAPKLTIACNTEVREGMEVSTHHTSKAVADAQSATLEFILVNHPLDCTVCDQAGHCKLQDYHYDYNGKASRFLEEKEHKVKAVPLGPTVMLDGERCIMCTRCVRFCDEVTGTTELGMLNRGDRSVISVNQARPLDNPLSGTVVDLCPVGALTHSEWRFNTRIWFTAQTDSVCPGCSTGCNVRVAERDGKVVQVKARLNDDVNKEWLCDEGRYGFDRFLPEDRLTHAFCGDEVVASAVAWAECVKALRDAQGAVAVLVAPDLLLEDYVALADLLKQVSSPSIVALAYRERPLTDTQAILISPDYAPNFQGAVWSGLVEGKLEARYQEVLEGVARGNFATVLAVGDRALPYRADLGEPVHHVDEITAGLKRARVTIGLVSDAKHPFRRGFRVGLPARSILERSGLLINRNGRLQYAAAVRKHPVGTEPIWRTVLGMLGQSGRQDGENTLFGGALTMVSSDREATRALLSFDSRLQGLSIKKIRDGGVVIAQTGSHAVGGQAPWS